jgi:hypothetical protein
MKRLSSDLSKQFEEPLYRKKLKLKKESEYG